MQSWQRRKIKECASNPIRSQWWTEAQSLGRATFPTRFSRPSPPFFPSPRLPPVRPPKLTTSRENSSRQKRSALLGKVTLGSKKWCQPKCNSFCILNSLRTHSLDKSYLKKSSSEPQTFGHGKWTVWCRTDYNDYDNDYNYGGPEMTTTTRTPRFFGRLPVGDRHLLYSCLTLLVGCTIYTNPKNT